MHTSSPRDRMHSEKVETECVMKGIRKAGWQQGEFGDEWVLLITGDLGA